MDELLYVVLSVELRWSSDVLTVCVRDGVGERVSVTEGELVWDLLLERACVSLSVGVIDKVTESVELAAKFVAERVSDIMDVKECVALEDAVAEGRDLLRLYVRLVNDRLTVSTAVKVLELVSDHDSLLLGVLERALDSVRDWLGDAERSSVGECDMVTDRLRDGVSEMERVALRRSDDALELSVGVTMDVPVRDVL